MTSFREGKERSILKEGCPPACPPTPPAPTPFRTKVLDAIEEVRSAVLFEDGLSGDLHSAGIRTLPAAYMAGRLDALEELQTLLKERTA